MTTPIDPIRRTADLRRAKRARNDAALEGQEVEDRTLPVVSLGSARPKHDAAPEGAAIFSAQLLGQDGQKRGLRGGPETLDAAKTVYGRTEWSGFADRRARRGGTAGTKI